MDECLKSAFLQLIMIKVSNIHRRYLQKLFAKVMNSQKEI